MDIGNNMSKPFIRINGIVREMTDEEHAEYLKRLENENSTTYLDISTDSE
jgi:hypothetical protein